MSPSRRSVRLDCARSFPAIAGCLALALALAACEGDDGAQGPPGPPGPPGTGDLTRADPLPGFNLQILSVTGGTGPGGNFQAGDTIVVNFTAKEGQQTDAPGDPIPPTKWAFQELLFAGPTENYQRILSSRDIAVNSVQNGDGSWTFRWPAAIPANVPNQANQANTIPYDSGTIAGQPLPSGTYTIGMSLRQDIEIEGTVFRDATSQVFEVLVGSASAIQRRELVTNANCEQCHTKLRAHGENRYGWQTCVLCHTNGAEDLNDPNAAAGATPGVSISFQTMIHKIHSGAHLPSVNGKTVDVNGNPVYGAGTPYVIVRASGEFDFSHVTFPQWPNLLTGMPRDLGYDALTSDQKTAENQILSGPTNCLACHGDPDAGGPLPAPVDGDTIFSGGIVTRGCIACHDDWDPSKPYTANNQMMPAALPDSACTECHGQNPGNPNSAINVRKAHTHPLLDNNNPPLWGAGAGAIDLRFNVTAVTEAPGDGDQLLEVGEKVQVTVQIVDGQGGTVAAADIPRLEIVVNGPVENPNLLYVATFATGSSTQAPPTSLLGAGPTHTFLLPQRYELEEPTQVSPTEFGTARTPHYDTKFGTSGATRVWTVPAIAGGTTLVAEVRPFQNYLDVASAVGFAQDDYIVIDEATPASREYVRIRAVQGNRLWLLTPIDLSRVLLQKQHLAGASVAEVVPVAETNFTLVEATGRITFAVAPTNRVLVSYTTDFVVPAKYGGTINNSPSTNAAEPDLDAAVGEWTGLDLVPGTYNIGVYGEVGFAVTVTSGPTTQVTSYTEGSQGNTILAFRLGSTGPIDANPRIESAATCYSCHRDLQFHGSHRRGYNNCLLCHGVAAAEDWPVFKTSGLSSPETPGVAIEFRQMVHKIHQGRNLAAGADYQVIGRNGSVNTFEKVGFLSFTGGTANCDACHGSGNVAWYAPTDRLHPTAALYAPQSNWRLVCGSCHDDRTATAHILANTSGGLESCLICHGDGKELSVELAHRHFVR